MKAPFEVMCEVCGRPVDKIEAWDDVATGRRRFVAECHGQIDVCAIDLREIIPGEIINATAFSQNAISTIRALPAPALKGG